MIRSLFVMLLLGAPLQSEGAIAPKRIIVCTTTTGYRHESIPSGEATLAALDEASSDFEIVSWLRQPNIVVPQAPISPKKPAEGASPEAINKYTSALASYQKAVEAWNRDVKPEADRKRAEFDAVMTNTLQALSPESLRKNQIDAVVFCNTSGSLPLPDLPGFINWIQSGGTLIAIHASSTTFKDVPAFADMLGGCFDYHDRQVPITLEAGDRTHPANGSIGSTWSLALEEMYLIKNYKSDEVRSIWFMSHHPNKPEKTGFFPVSWVRQFGQGRVFYTSLGHRVDLWSIDPALPDRINSIDTATQFRNHLLGGVRWALGLEKGSAEPKPPAAAEASESDVETGVQFTSDNPKLQRIFDAIVHANVKNLDRMEDGRKVLVEGDIWRGIWLETQPMGGAMYGKFDPEPGRNNFDVVFEGQYENGKLPHLTRLKGPHTQHHAVAFNAVPQYGLDFYYLLHNDPAFLNKLENALTRYEAFLWEDRGTKGNGVLIAYCTSDTGEDGQANNRFDLGRERDKTANPRFVYSVSVTADSYANRAVLAKIAEIKGDVSKRQYWQAKADELQNRARDFFWVEERKAAFDRDSSGNILSTLNQLNIRAMTQGLFTQRMASDFVKYHLMNPEEFFTPFPIPSTAVNDSTFVNLDKNSEYCSWAGPSMGLTLQRAVKALENYGCYVEIGLIGARLLNRIAQDPVGFPVQFDPLTGKPAGRTGAYGPMILSTMEYLSRMYGVYVDRDVIVWNGLPGGNLQYKQTWNHKDYRLVQQNGRVSGFLGEKKLFEVPPGLRVETDYQGKVKKVTGISPEKVSGVLFLGTSEVKDFTIGPNEGQAFP